MGYIVVAIAMVAGRAHAESTPAETLTVVLVGDVGLNRNHVPVESGGSRGGAELVPWTDMTRGISSLIDGDLNFMNLETVVTDDNSRLYGAIIAGGLLLAAALSIVIARLVARRR